MHCTGQYALFFVVPFFIGACICGIAGCAAGVYIFAWLSDRIIDRMVRQFNLYDAVLATGIQRIQARRKKRAEKTM